ncbi:unnamed protein product [Triticum turgidum subsp. durum]|uniref:Peptidase A1 domain-containing protein n=1 Tax=Triticum turgidum subsp. durum TaxID=4567 RepID=A0A9R0TGS1_TRITD|nr:unnamed protein product [Triticum turgidum subsp. durum]
MARTLVLLLVLLCSSASLVTSSTSAGAGLRMKLTHVDDKAGYTTEERVRRAVALSRERLASMQQQRGAVGDVSAPVHLATRQYIAEYLIGDPPQRADALIDTGSNLIWTQCATTCLKACAKQDLPYYNLSSSASFAPVSCADSAKLCAANGVHLCGLDGSCTFIASYGAGSVIGSLGTEAFTFQSGAARLAFGCVSLTQIAKGALNGASGLIGLGRGRLSLVSQTGATKFSYCLTPYLRNHGASSHLFVGASASLSGAGGAVTSIPFVKSPKEYPYSTFYYLPLTGISEGGYESVIGNFQQQDLHLLYDIGKGELSFQTADCSAL